MMSQSPNEDKGNVLIVDDTLPNLRLLSIMLTNNGYQVSEAMDGPTALQWDLKAQVAGIHFNENHSHGAIRMRLVAKEGAPPIGHPLHAVKFGTKLFPDSILGGVSA